MADLSALSADQLAQEIIRLEPPDPGSFGGLPYSPKERELGYGTWRDPRFAQCRALSELVRRASERDQAVREREDLRDLRDHHVAMLDKATASCVAATERADRLAAALAPEPYRGRRHVLCGRCGGQGEVTGIGDDPKWVPCSSCEGTGLGQKVRDALAAPRR